MTIPTPPATLQPALAKWEALRPEADFLVELETGQTATYAAFGRAVRALRRALGGEPRTIALALPGGIAAAVVWIAALTGGHRLLPISPESMPAERLRLGERQRPDALVVADADAALDFAQPAAQVFTDAEIAALAARPAVLDDVALAEREGSLRLTTSGTTGEPKGIVLEAQQIGWTAEQVRRSHHLTPEDRGLCVLPFFHINAPVVSLCATLLAGGAVAIAPRFSLHRFWEEVERERISWASAVPTIVALLLSTERPATPPSALRFVRTASAPLPVAHHLAFEQRFGVALVETYGLSEAGSQVAANPVPPGRRKPGSVGLPTGVVLRICEPLAEGDARELHETPAGVIGEICVHGPNVVAGYASGEDSASFVDGWCRTGDLGFRDVDGYVFITGRLREIINRGGEKVSPREVEEVLLAHPNVRDVAVVGEPGPPYGQRIVPHLDPRDAWTQAGSAELRAYCAARLSGFKVPETFYAVEALPRNGNGKLARRPLASAVSRGAVP